MANAEEKPNFNVVVKKIERQYFGKYGVVGVSEDSRNQTISLQVLAENKREFEKHRKEIEEAAAPYIVSVRFGEKPVVLSRANR